MASGLVDFLVLALASNLEGGTLAAADKMPRAVCPRLAVGRMFPSVRKIAVSSPVAQATPFGLRVPYVKRTRAVARCHSARPKAINSACELGRMKMLLIFMGAFVARKTTITFARAILEGQNPGSSHVLLAAHPSLSGHNDVARAQPRGTLMPDRGTHPRLCTYRTARRLSVETSYRRIADDHPDKPLARYTAMSARASRAASLNPVTPPNGTRPALALFGLIDNVRWCSCFASSSLRS